MKISCVFNKKKKIVRERERELNDCLPVKFPNANSKINTIVSSVYFDPIC